MVGYFVPYSFTSFLPGFFKHNHMKVKLLYATKIGQPDYMEELLTDKEGQFEAAKNWAQQNGFDRFRVATCDLSTKPDFTKTII